jgi:hypothetical protein
MVVIVVFIICYSGCYHCVSAVGVVVLVVVVVIVDPHFFIYFPIIYRADVVVGSGRPCT